MATITVDTLNDVIDANDGVTSLREAIIQANANADADTILFDASLIGGTLQLTGELSLETDITIDGDLNGDNIADINILGDGFERVFHITEDNTDVTLNGLNISGGYDINYGGNIFADYISSLTITNSSISGGHSGVYGGNIHAREVESFVVRDSSITGGESSYGGGIAVEQRTGHEFSLINSLVANNTTIDALNGLGGGVYMFGISAIPGTTNIIGSTITGNTAGTGGGISSIASDMTIHNSTIVGNTAYYRGGGVNIDENDVLVLTNSVLAENISTTNLSTPDHGGESDVTSTNSFFGTTVVITTDNGGNINNGGDAGLGVLGDYGGSTQTLWLEADSALRGAGSTAALPTDIYDLDGDGNFTEAWSRDATGNSRVVETLDIGASEYTLSSNVVVSTLNDENDGDYSFGDLSLREALYIVTDGGTITFDASLSGGTISLTGGVLSTPRDVTINGDVDADGASDIILSGMNNNGILELTDGNHILQSLTFLNGDATDGGALNIGVDASVQGRDLNFLSNFALDNGGAIFNGGSLSLINSTLASNDAGVEGGAIYNIGDLTLVNVTAALNQSGASGGGLYAGGSEAIFSSTFVQNLSGFGGGITDAGPAATLTNSIVTNNEATVSDDDLSGSSAQLVGGNIVGGDIYAGTSIVGSTTFEAIFGANTLADNGGTVSTYALTSGSSAQGAGDLASLSLDTFDIDGDSDFSEFLPLDANGELRSDDGALDLGAVEYIGPEFTGVLSDASEAFSFLETVSNGYVVIDADANDGFGGVDDANVTYSLLGNLDGDGDGTFAFGIDSAGLVTVTDADDISFDNNYSGEFDLYVVADNGASSNATSQALLDISIIDIPQTYTVTTLSDLVDANDGVLSLREALVLADRGPAQDTIVFDAALSGGTITLAASSLNIVRDIIITGDIDGDGTADITIDGNSQSRIFTISAETELDGLNITGGNAVDGGGILNNFGSTVTITNSSIYGNSATDGGGIFTAGGMNIVNTTIENNSAVRDGGGLFSSSVIEMNTVTIANNSAGDDGGGVYAENTTGLNVLDMVNVTIVANTANDDGGGLISRQGDVFLDNSTVTGNIAGDNGGGVRFTNNGYAELNNSIVSGNGGNTNNDIAGVYSSNSTIIGGNTADIFASLNGIGGALADNGGTVETVAIRAGGAAHSTGDINLLISDNFDLDGDSIITENLPLDANGNDRVVGTLDIGAVEYVGPEFEDVLVDGTELFAIDETIAQNTVLMDVNANDGIGGAADVNVTYSILSGNDNGAFAIDSATGVVTVANTSAIDVETGPSSFNLVVQADNGETNNNLATATIAVTVNDVSETLVVTTLLDVVDANDGVLSLREAIMGANNGDAQETITFDASLADGVITLGSDLDITQDITIDGDVDADNRADITISGGGTQGIFAISGTDTDARLLSLTLDNADGAINAVNASSVLVMNSTIMGSNTTGNAGGVSVVNTDASIVNSLIVNNDGALSGGVYSDGGNLMLINTHVVGNNSAAGTGGVVVASGWVNITSSTIADNVGGVAGGVDAVGNGTFTNTVVAGNLGGSGNDDAQAGDLIATNSFFGASVTIDFNNGGNTNGGGDAGLLGLYDRGATTLTMGLETGSALIDAGSNAALPNDIYDIDEDSNTSETLPTDARGARIQNGTTDIGAVELSANETLTTTNASETVTGSSNSDTIYALAGNDLVYGRDGDDTIYGGDGNDNLRGNNGDDYLDGGFGADILRGGAGADVLFGGAGTDVADYTTSGGTTGVTVNLTTNINTGGDAEGDTLYFIDRVNGSSRADHITGNANVNYLRGFAQDDTLIGGAGNDYLQGDAGADTLDGGAGTNDWAYYASSSVGVTVNLEFTNLNTGEAIGDIYIGIENLLGSRHDDDLTGDGSNNFVRGLQGDDALHGGGGNDFLRGDQGADLHDGGAGVDWAYYATSSAAVTIDLGAGTASGGDAEGDTFNSIERVYGSSFADSITGDGGANYLRGSFGNDTLIGGGGTDFLQGDSGADFLDGGAGSDWAYYASAGVGVTVNLGDTSQNTGEAIGDSYISIENVVGSRFNDTITGDSGDNYLRGFSGDDVLNGGAGNDILRGEAGADTFVFEVGTGTDVVIDYNDAQDLLDFTDFGVTNALDNAQQVGDDVVFTFGTDVITIEDATLADLADNLI